MKKCGYVRGMLCAGMVGLLSLPRGVGFMLKGCLLGYFV